jgi:hypothetical protein
MPEWLFFGNDGGAAVFPGNFVLVSAEKANRMSL